MLLERWLLPDEIEELLPPQAQKVEAMRQTLLNLFDTWGYELVIPPALEYLDSLLTGSGEKLELKTFKVTDQLSGRMLGLSADTTPQVARIDAHSLAKEGVSRLSYCRTVFHTRSASLLASRTPTQIGVELFGVADQSSDLEILSLMLATLDAAQIKNVHLDLGHLAVLDELMAAATFSQQDKDELFSLLSLKCKKDIHQWLASKIKNDALLNAFKALVSAQGHPDCLDELQKALSDQYPKSQVAIHYLQSLIAQIKQRFSDVSFYVDLTELRGYSYHTGLVFAAFVPEYGDAIALGGRYDDNGALFGRARPAIGFSADLKVLVELSGLEPQVKSVIKAPAEADHLEHAAELWNLVQNLRAQGNQVITHYPNQPDFAFDQEIVYLNGQWQLA